MNLFKRMFVKAQSPFAGSSYNTLSLAYVADFHHKWRMLTGLIEIRLSSLAREVAELNKLDCYTANNKIDTHLTEITNQLKGMREALRDLRALTNANQPVMNALSGYFNFPFYSNAVESADRNTYLTLTDLSARNPLPEIPSPINGGGGGLV